jgi:hypothetical protein
MRSPLMRLRSSRALMMVGALGMAYVGFNFLAVLIASGADHRDPVDAIVVLGLHSTTVNRRRSFSSDSIMHIRCGTKVLRP